MQVIKKLLPLSALFFCFVVSYSQNAAPDLPSQISLAAASSFHEYNGPTFDELIAKDSGKHNLIVIPRTFDPSPGAGVFHPNQPPVSHIGHLVARSDFAGAGIAVKRWTIPTDDKSFAVSIYLVHITDIAYSKNEALKINSDIYIVRAGGPITYEGHNFRAIDSNFRLLHLNEPYIFFGSLIAPGAYKIDSDQVLEIHDNVVQEASQSKRHTAAFKSKSARDILKEAFSEWQQQPLKNAGER